MKEDCVYVGIKQVLLHTLCPWLRCALQFNIMPWNSSMIFIYAKDSYFHDLMSCWWETHILQEGTNIHSRLIPILPCSMQFQNVPQSLSSFYGTQQCRCLPHLTWRLKRIKFLMCFLVFRISDGGWCPKMLWFWVLYTIIRTL
jgi:hypothetical protein